MYSKKAQRLPTRTIVIAVVAIVALFAAVIIYLGLGTAAGQQARIVSGGVDTSTPSNYEMLFKGIGAQQPCFEDYSENIIQGRPTQNELNVGENKVCWTPPAVYGKESSDSGRQFYGSNIYACPTDSIINKITFEPELEDEKDTITIKGRDKDSNLVYTNEDIKGPYSASKDIMLDIRSKKLKTAQFWITVDQTKAHYFSNYKGVQAKSIECVPTPADLVPALDTGGTLFKLGQPISYTYGYQNNGGSMASCKGSVVRLYVASSLSNIILDAQMLASDTCGFGGWASGTITPSKAGAYAFYITVDENRVVDESDEGNNILFKTVTVY